MCNELPHGTLVCAQKQIGIISQCCLRKDWLTLHFLLKLINQDVVGVSRLHLFYFYIRNWFVLQFYDVTTTNWHKGYVNLLLTKLLNSGVTSIMNPLKFIQKPLNECHLPTTLCENLVFPAKNIFMQGFVNFKILHSAILSFY